MDSWNVFDGTALKGCMFYPFIGFCSLWGQNLRHHYCSAQILVADSRLLLKLRFTPLREADSTTKRRSKPLKGLCTLAEKGQIWPSHKGAFCEETVHMCTVQWEGATGFPKVNSSNPSSGVFPPKLSGPLAVICVHNRYTISFCARVVCCVVSACNENILGLDHSSTSIYRRSKE